MATKKKILAGKKPEPDYGQIIAQKASERTVLRTVQELMRDVFKEFSLEIALNVGALMFAIAEEHQTDTARGHKAFIKAVLAECKRIRKGLTSAGKPKVKRKTAAVRKKAVKKTAAKRYS